MIDIHIYSLHTYLVYRIYVGDFDCDASDVAVPSVTYLCLWMASRSVLHRSYTLEYHMILPVCDIISFTQTDRGST